MSGLPQFNYPAFIKAAELLRSWGYEIISPAELDDPTTREKALASPDGDQSAMPGQTWGDFLSRDVKIVADKVGGIILLDDWQDSRGAKLEVMVGLLCKHKFGRFYESNQRLAALDAANIAFTLAGEISK